MASSGKPGPPPNEALESKGSTRPWAIQSHYDHPGWYMVWRYAIDPTKRMTRGRADVVWRVDIPYLRKEQWKYEGSRAAEATGEHISTRFFLFLVLEPLERGGGELTQVCVRPGIGPVQ